MAIPNTYMNGSKQSNPAPRGLANPYSYISEYDKHRRYYYRDVDDRYQIDSYNQQQFESIYRNPNGSHS